MRTAITIAVLLLLAGCDEPVLSNVGFKVIDKHGPGLKGGDYVVCAKPNGIPNFTVYVDEATLAVLKVGDTCPNGTRG